MSTSKLSLPAFLRIFANGNMSMPKAMAVASKIYKTHNTPFDLGKLTDLQLNGLGVENKEDRKQILVAIKRAGYKESSSSQAAGPSRAQSAKNSSSPRKRRRGDSINELLPDGPPDEGASFGSFDFNEVMDENVLQTKSTVVNRAPIMTAWATVVAERMGFKREEALSIASAYTEMNAISKGVSLGIFDQGKGKGIELAKGESQPYVDLMGRRPVFTTKTEQWRALVQGEPIEPATAFSHMSRSLRQTFPHVLGAMRLLADTYSPTELNKRGFGLYAEFRPEVDGWGKKAEVRCEKILALRRSTQEGSMAQKSVDSLQLVTVDQTANDDTKDDEAHEPSHKRAKSLSVEEYEALLDSSSFYDDFAFSDLEGM